MFVCKICRTGLQSVQSFFIHIKAFHRLATQFSCPFKTCSKVFSMKKSLRNHCNSKTAHLNLKCASTSLLSVPSNTSSSTSLGLVPTNNLTSSVNLVNVTSLHPNSFKTINISEKNSVKNLISVCKTDTLKHAVELLSDENIPRNKAIEITNKCFDSQAKLISNMEKCGLLSTENVNDCEELLDFFGNPSSATSEYKVVKELIKNGYYIHSKDKVIGSENQIRFVNNVRTIVTEKYTLKLFSLKEMLTKFFNLPNVMSQTVNFINNKKECTDGSISNVIQTPLWRNLMSREQQDPSVLYLPMSVFFDDFEPLNCLGSHSGAYKIGGVYSSIPCLPDHLVSKLKYIFPVSIFFSGDRKKYGNARMFRPIIKILNELHSQGIDVNYQGIKKIKILVTNITGDNLGLNSMLGFVESFTSHYFCRFCKSHRMETHCQLKEDLKKLRNAGNYIVDVKINNYTETGIKEICVFNELKTFYVTINLSVDIMHDIFEGVCNYDLSNIIKKLIEKKTFTLDYLNDCIRHHNYGPLIKNKTLEPITTEMLSKHKIRSSASEMHTLITNFSLIIGHKVDPQSDEWKLYTVLRQIIDVITAKTVNERTYELVESLIEEHHELYLKCFDDTLKPKHHILVHYSRIMRMIGPLKPLCCMRFESFHKKFKNISKSVTCRKSLLTTFAKKLEFQFANFLFNYEDEIFTPTLGKNEYCDDSSTLKKYNLKITSNKISVTGWVRLSGIFVKRNCVIQVGREIDETPIFGLIKDIVCVDGKKVFLCCQLIENEGFNHNYYAYSVSLGSRLFAVEFDADYLDKISYVFEARNAKKFVSF